MTYEQTLKRARKTGAFHASDAELMALFCDGELQILVGAASPKLVWNGAQKKNMSTKQLSALCITNPNAVHDLMWI
jgi:hypothetical protein